MTKPLYRLEQSWEWSWWCLGSSESRVPHTRPAPSYNWFAPLHESNNLTFFLLTTRTGLPIPVMLIFQRRVDASTQQRPHHLDLGFNREISEPRHQKWTDKSPELHFFATMKQPVRLCLTECLQTKVIDQSNTLPGPNKQTKVTIEDLATERSQTRREKKQKAKKQN